jgi:ubiquinone biosynthesis protein
VENVRALSRLPELIRRIDHYFPPPGAAPPGPPLPDLVVVTRRTWLRDLVAGLAGGGIAIAGFLLLS